MVMEPPVLDKKLLLGNYRRRTLWRLQGPVKYKWAFRENDETGRIRFLDQRYLEDWLDSFKKDEAHLYKILQTTVDYIIIEVSDVSIKK